MLHCHRPQALSAVSYAQAFKKGDALKFLPDLILILITLGYTALAWYDIYGTLKHQMAGMTEAQKADKKVRATLNNHMSTDMHLCVCKLFLLIAFILYSHLVSTGILQY